MKSLLLLLLVITVTAAYRVIEASEKSKPDFVGYSVPDTAPPDVDNTSEKSSPSFFGTSPVSSIFKLMQDAFSSIMEEGMADLPKPFSSKDKIDVDSLIKIGVPQLGIPGLLSIKPPGLGDTPQVGFPDMKKLPPNYSNSTSEVQHSKHGKILVNQTIDKKTGDGFTKLFVRKTVQMLPKTQNISKDIKNEVFLASEAPKNLLNPDTRLNEVGEVNPLEKEKLLQEPIDEDENRIIRRIRREINNKIGNPSSKAENQPIEFLPSNLNRFPQSFDNNKNFKLEDLKRIPGGESVSKSYVYKNIGGKTTFYIVNHGPKSESKKYTKGVGTSVVGRIPPPDLTRDTKVNPSGDNDQQQGLVLVHPDAEVFDLNLVAKEIESRPKDK